MQVEKVRLLIIGSGPAGYTAGIYASRAGLAPLLYQGDEPGGQLTITTDVENYPGYKNGIQGPEMMLDFKKQAQRFGTIVRTGKITSVNFKKRPFEAIADKQTLIHADAVIISTGASAKWLNLESEERLNGKGVSACAVCDGFFYKGEDVAVVGGGDTAAEEALFLSRICKNVYMMVRSNKLKASKIMQKRLFDKKNIEVLWNHDTLEILGNNEVEGIKLLNNKTRDNIELKIKGFFVAIGHKPNTEIFQDQISLDNQGYIIVRPGSSKTNIEGIFAAGDVQDKVYRQAVTAAGSGCMAALDAERFLS